MEVGSLWHFLIDIEFYVHFLIGGAGLVYAILAYNAANRAEKEAKLATAAAQKAAESAKIQSAVLDISNIITACNNIDSEITFEDASSKNTELASKIRRIISFYRHSGDEDLNNSAQAIIQTLEQLRSALNNYDEASGISVYRSVELHFSTLSIFISEYSGILERKQIIQK